MIEKVIQVKSTEQKMAKNENPYLEVTTHEDKKNSIFDQGLWNLFFEGAWVKLSLEKKGNFWNVTGAEAVSAELGKQQAKVEREDNEIGINRRSALDKATNLAVAGHIAPDKILSYTEVFLRYLHGDISVKDEVVFQSLIHKVFQVKEE